MKKFFEIFYAFAVVIGMLLAIGCVGTIEHYNIEGIRLAQWSVILFGSIAVTIASGYCLYKISD